MKEKEALILNAEERKKLISACYNQLKPNGYMIFVSISKMDFRYGKGKEVGQDTFEMWPGLTLYFYDLYSIKADFGNFGLVGAEAINEPVLEVGDKPKQKFWYIVCQKV